MVATAKPSDALPIFGQFGSSWPPKPKWIGNQYGYNAKDFAPPWAIIGDGEIRRLSGKYSSLTAAQNDFPGATSLDQTYDTACINSAYRFVGGLPTYKSPGGEPSPANANTPIPTGTILLPPGDYRAEVDHSKPYVDLVGCTGAIIRPESGTAIHVQNIADFKGGAIRNLRISGLGRTGEVTGIFVESASHFEFSGLDILELEYGVVCNFDKPKEVAFNDVVITRAIEVAFDYYKTIDQDNGGLYLWNLRVAGYHDEVPNDISLATRSTSIGFRCRSTHTPGNQEGITEGFGVSGQTATGMVFSALMVLDGRFKKALWLENVDGLHFVQSFIGGNLGGEGLVYLKNVKDVQICQSLIQNDGKRVFQVAINPETGEKYIVRDPPVLPGTTTPGPPVVLVNVPGYCVEIDVDERGRQSADVQFNCTRFTAREGYDFFYHTRTYVVEGVSKTFTARLERSTVTDSRSTTVLAGGQITNRPDIHALCYREIPWTRPAGSKTAIVVPSQTSQYTCAEFTIVKSLLKENGGVRVFCKWDCYDEINPNPKTVRVKFGNAVYLEQVIGAPNDRLAQYLTTIDNMGVANAQMGGLPNGQAYGVTTAEIVTSSINTNTTDVVVSITGQKAVAGNNLRLVDWWIELRSAADAGFN